MSKKTEQTDREHIIETYTIIITIIIKFIVLVTAYNVFPNYRF